jgi:hypothetical protein
MKRIENLDVVIQKKGEVFFAGIPQIELYAKADSAQAALAELEKKKLVLYADIGDDDFHVSADAQQRPALHPASAPSPGLWQFFVKTTVVIAILVGALTLGGLTVVSKVQQSVERTQAKLSIGGRQFWTKVEEGIARAADPKSDLPEPLKAKLLADIRTIVARWQPFLAELAKLASESPKADSKN